MKEKYVCCICRKEFTGYGNNPEPLVRGKDLECCDECNQLVIAARTYGITAEDLKTKEGTKKAMEKLEKAVYSNE